MGCNEKSFRTDSKAGTASASCIWPNANAASCARRFELSLVAGVEKNASNYCCAALSFKKPLHGWPLKRGENGSIEIKIIFRTLKKVPIHQNTCQSYVTSFILQRIVKHWSVLLYSDGWYTDRNVEHRFYFKIVEPFIFQQKLSILQNSYLRVIQCVSWKIQSLIRQLHMKHKEHPIIQQFSRF